MISGRGSYAFPFLCVVKKIAAKYDFVLCQPLYLSCQKARAMII